MALGFLAGCSDKEDPGTLPKTPKPSSSSASPTPATPEEEVEAAVRAYYAEIVDAARTGDTTELETLVMRKCPCYRAVKVINRNHRAGEATPDLSIDLALVKVHDVEPRLAAAEVKTVDAAYDVVDSSGDVVDRIPKSSTHLDLSLVKDEDGRWVVANYFNLEG